ncbi:MAG: hypothetical protein JNJ83_19595 [Verrucomicrobiaceae bacterium]|nr:hypothetical protein [Verrucomicrobiaceae bacterium]
MAISWFINGLRLLFVAFCVYLGVYLAPGFGAGRVLGGGVGFLIGSGVVGLDVLLARVSVRHFSHAVVGLMAGLFCAFLITRLGLLQLGFFETSLAMDTLRNTLEVAVYAVLGFLGTTLAVRSDRDQFAVLIPYIRFRRDSSEGDPMLLDTNVVIDGRVPKLVQTGFLTGRMVVPQMVLEELQRLADSRDPVKAERGKRGLLALQEMRGMKQLDVSIHQDVGSETEPIDSRLMSLAHAINARLLTNDENLSKVARLRGITVLMLTELVRALENELHAGDEVELLLVKLGKDKHQAVGYLPDGAMVVVNQASQLIGQSVRATITGTTQTSAGRLVFGELTTP